MEMRRREASMPHLSNRFKIDVIVWKSYNEVLGVGCVACFKIDVIVWK